MEGWIKLHRQLIDSEWFTDVNTNHLFMYCLMRANHKDTKWQGIDIFRGQFITSLDSLSSATGLSVRQIRTSLKKLITTSNLTSKTTNKYRVISVTNYVKYQGDDKQLDKPATSQRQTNDKPATTDKNNNNNKNENNDKNLITLGDFDSFWSAYGKIGNKQQAIKSYNKSIKQGASHEEIIRGVTSYQSQCQALGQEQRYIKHASTWLNNRGWEDDYTIHQPAAGKQGSLSKHERAKIALGLT
jgi:hypothetical protein